MSQLLHLAEFTTGWEGVPALILVGGFVGGAPRRPEYALAAVLAWALVLLEGGGGAHTVLSAALGALFAGSLRPASDRATAVAAVLALALAWWSGGRTDLGQPGLVRVLASPALGYAAATVCSLELLVRFRRGSAAAVLLCLGVALSLEGRVRIAEASACLALAAGVAAARRRPGPRARVVLACLGLALGAALAGGRGSGAYIHPDGVPVRPSLRATLEVPSAGLVSGLAVAPDGRVFFGELTSGRIRVRGSDGRVRDAASWPPAQPADYRAESWEAGLWGLAVDPTGSWLYAMAATRFDPSEGHRAPLARSTVRRWSIRGPALGPPEDVIADLPAAAVHSGGALAIAPDGRLFVSVGDGGASGAGDPRTGAVLRLEPDGRIPLDNPIPGSPVFVRGLRNPYGLAFDADGQLLLTDNGPHCCDRLYRLGAGADAGWPRYGTHPDDAARATADPAVSAPLWDSGTSRVSPTGLVPRAGGRFWFATWHTAAVHEVTLTAEGVFDHRIVLDARAARTPGGSAYAFPGGISALAVGPEGEVWWGGLGGIGRLVAR